MKSGGLCFVELEKSQNNGVLCRLDYKERIFLLVCHADREGKRLCDASWSQSEPEPMSLPYSAWIHVVGETGEMEMPNWSTS